VTLGHATLPEHIDQFTAVLPGIVERLRNLSVV